MPDLGNIGYSLNTVKYNSRLVVSPDMYNYSSNGTSSVMYVDVTGVLSGIVKISDVPTGGIRMGLYSRSSGKLLQLTFTESNGYYVFRGLDKSNIAEYEIKCMDNSKQIPYNFTLVKDHLTAG